MVGQFENSLMPWRISGSVRTLTPLNLTPSSERMFTTAAENPHCGKTGVPFMNTTTSFEAMSAAIRSCAGLDMAFLWFGKGDPARDLGTAGLRVKVGRL